MEAEKSSPDLQAPGQETTTGADLGRSNVVPDVEQSIPKRRQEEPILLAEGAKIYEEEMLKCQKILNELAEQAASRARGLQRAREGL